MDLIALESLARWSDGSLLSGDAAQSVSAVCTDSRALKTGDLFFALRGENFDGHAFVAQAAKLGALGAVVDQVPEVLPANFAVLKVEDTLHALQQIASCYRQSLPLKVLAITGSNGKTSTKDLSAAVLSESFQVTKTAGNFNNHIGLPLTMLSASASDQVGVFEIGMNHPGEIAPLAALAAPGVAIITNIGIAHIEYMKTQEAIALEKGMLAEALPSSGHLILCADDKFSPGIAARTHATSVYCGIESGDVQASELRQDFDGTHFLVRVNGQSVEAQLPVPGVHMVQNALLAVGAGLVLGLSLEQCVSGLGKLQLTKGRLQQKIVRGIQILDDTYNANPDSTAAALRTLAQMPTTGRRIAVLGRMGELGAESQRGHQQVGEVAAREGIDFVIGVGAECACTTESAHRAGVKDVRHFATVEEAVSELRSTAQAGDVVLVKGSRSARMERIVEGLQAL